MSQIKIYFASKYHGLNTKLFAQNNVAVVSDINECDYIVTRNFCDYPELIYKTVYIAQEPPKMESVIWCYKNFDKFKLVVTFNPDPAKENQIPFNSVDYPCWVSIPLPHLIPIYRPDTTIKTRGVYFAGSRMQPSAPNIEGTFRIRHLRKIIGESLLHAFPDSVMIGCGWNGRKEERPLSWREDKLKMIPSTNTDFVLALENTIIKNYVTEKIWDGFYSDKVTLYLGAPNINDFVSNECFVDLRPFFDIDKNIFDTNGLIEKIKNISQDEYDSMIKHARKIRTIYCDRRNFHQDAMTINIINRLKNCGK